MPPTGHALLSASSAHRWLVCTAAPRYEAQFPPGATSVYAEEGTLAHELCELRCNKQFKGLDDAAYAKRLAQIQQNQLYKPEMMTTSQAYVDYLLEKAHGYTSMPYMAFEVRVDLSEVVPNGFGTCDAIMIGGDTLHITDYKHGMGVPVSAVGNPQMRLYALGALRKYRPVYGNSIKRVSMGIVQPRVTEDFSEDTITVDELLAWADRVKQIAAIAYNGKGEFKPGEHCRFCRGRDVCKARAESMLALKAVAGVVDDGKKAEATRELGTLTEAEIADAIRIGACLADWYEGLKDYAKQAILNGRTIPGYKVVAGKSNRVFSIAVNKLLAILRENGLTDEQIFKPREQRSLSDLEKQMGKKVFAEKLGEYVVKPMGKPALATIDDSRPDYSPAENDFAGIS